MKHSHKKPKGCSSQPVSKESNSLQSIERKPNNFFWHKYGFIHESLKDLGKKKKTDPEAGEAVKRRDRIGSESICVLSDPQKIPKKDPQKINWHAFTLLRFSRECGSLLWIVSVPRGVAWW
jgi:hypothetical protein